MFQGSRHVAKAEHIALVQAAGGTLNGSTCFDRTNYFETLPAHQLELALWLEADRMATLLDALSQENLDNQREVVKNEKRWSYDNRPYGSFQEKLQAPSLPGRSTPTTTRRSARWTTSTRPPSRTSASSSGPTTRRTTPCCRSSATSTPITSAQLPSASSEPSRPTRTSRRSATCRCRRRSARSVRETVLDRVPLPRVHVGFRAPVFGDTRLDALDLAGQILVGRQGQPAQPASRPRRADRPGRRAVHARVHRRRRRSRAGWATVRPGVAVARVEAAFIEEIERLTTELVSDDELARAKALTEADELGALQRVEERADRLSMYATLFDDPGLINQMLPRYLAVTPEAIRDVARDVFRADNRLVLTYLPEGTSADDGRSRPTRPASVASGRGGGMSTTVDEPATARSWPSGRPRHAAAVRVPGGQPASAAQRPADPHRRPARPAAGVGVAGRRGRRS